MTNNQSYDELYKAEVSKYKKKDAIIAIYFFAFYIVISVVLGIVGSLTGLTVLTSISFGVITLSACIILVVKRDEGISSIGFKKDKLWLSLWVGLLCGFSYVFVNGLLQSFLFDWHLAPVMGILATLLFQIFIISLPEEVIYRGYIQTRLYGLFKNEISAVIMGAFLFSIMHIPYRLLIGNFAFELNTLIWLVVLLVWHIIFNFIYKRTGSIYGVVIFHALSNTSGYLFVNNSTNLPIWTNYTTLIYLGLWVVLLCGFGVRTTYMRKRTK